LYHDGAVCSDDSNKVEYLITKMPTVQPSRGLVVLVSSLVLMFVNTGSILSWGRLGSSNVPILNVSLGYRLANIWYVRGLLLWVGLDC
jgi:hypothetical protein